MPKKVGHPQSPRARKAAQRNWLKFRVRGLAANLMVIRQDANLTEDERHFVEVAFTNISAVTKKWNDEHTLKELAK